jgi:hypothetical protein
VSIAEVTADQYHADEMGDQPTLSRSIAHILCTQTPAHAWVAHPKLNPLHVPVDKDAFDLGTAAHELFLGGPDRMAILEFDNYRTKAAQEAKFIARAEGRIPMLAKDAARLAEMVDALGLQVDEHPADPPLFKDGAAEQTLVWADEGVTCRARLDWVHTDASAIDDLKTTSSTANPFEWSLFNQGYDLQAFMYARAVQLTAPLDLPPKFRFVVIETTPPYAMSVIEPGPDVLTLARKKFAYAAEVWRKCLDSGEWPAYPAEVTRAELPPWVENRWLAKEEREMVA